MLRSTYALLLLAWLCIMLIDQFPAHGLLAAFQQSRTMLLGDWAEFARRYAIALLTLQTGAVLALTPAYLAGSLTEEKERRTLDLLFASPLRDRELVLGKMFGRLMHLSIFLLAALPIFALVRLWGGVDDDLLIGGLTVTFMTMLSVGAFSMLCSVVYRSVLGAVVTSYVCVFVLNVACLAVPMTSSLLFIPAWTVEVDQAWREWQELIDSLGPSAVATLYPQPNPTAILVGRLIPFVLVHGFIFLACTVTAIIVLRECCLAPGHVVLRGVAPKDQSVMAWDPPSWLNSDARWHLPIGVYSPKPVREPALLWKEMVHGADAAAGPSLGDWLQPVVKQVVVVLACVASVSLLLSWRFPATWSAVLEVFNGLIRVVSVLLAGIWCLQTAFRAAGCVSRERGQQTLDGLLMLPGDREEIIRAKWWGSILRYRQLGYTLGVMWIIGMALGALHPWAVLLLAAACAVHIAFLASLGLWLSIVSRNTLWANMGMAAAFLCLFLGSALSWTVAQPVARVVGEESWLRGLQQIRIAPVHTWWYVAFSWTELANALATRDQWLRRAFVEAIGGLPIYAAAAYLFWRLARRRFEDARSWRQR